MDQPIKDIYAAVLSKFCQKNIFQGGRLCFCVIDAGYPCSVPSSSSLQ